MRSFLLSAILVLALLSCKEKAQPSGAPAAPVDSAAAQDAYLPVQDLILDEWRQVETYAGGILKKTERSGRKDSAYINPAQFRSLAAAFLSPALDSAEFRQQFEETSLMDESSRLLNFIYTARDTSQDIRKVIVYVTPSLSIDKVDLIYLEKQFPDKGDLVEQKLFWKSRQYFSIITIRHTAGGKTILQTEKVIWDPLRFGD